ncbi:MAG TPA: zinc ribbon domain-containing protein [Pyrinomonadaceae bacterium]|nr:zinc ribbon domain-containing protein [Pyrinomonadaceae bacterium]
MFCPKCATQNVDDARFCRACGADISLVPQALGGNLPAAPDEDRRERRRHRRQREREEKERPTVEKGVQNILGGLGFVLVALSVFFFAPAGRIWFFWLFLPAFFMFGEGIAAIMRARRERPERLPHARAYGTIAPPPHLPHELPSHDPSAYVPPSVTENTTRHLGVRDERLK